MKALEISLIRTDGGTQPRVEVNLFTVADYAGSIREGVIFPPITVFFDGVHYWLADGFHRLGATAEAGLTEIQADIRNGTLQDAQWYSFGANSTHGLRRTNDDKRRAILAALAHPKGRTLSDGQIAEHCGVSQQFVSKHRLFISTPTHNDCESIRHGRDGRIINTANIGKKSVEDQVVNRVLQMFHDQGLTSDMPPVEPADQDADDQGQAESVVGLTPQTPFSRVRRAMRFSDAIRILSEVDDFEDYAIGLWEIDPMGTQFINRIGLAVQNLNQLQQEVLDAANRNNAVA